MQQIPIPPAGRLTNDTNQQSMPTPRSEFLAGIKAEIPITIRRAALRLDLRRAGRSCRITAGPGYRLIIHRLCRFGPVYRRSAHWRFHAGFVIWLTTFIVNLRHMLYSTSLAPHTKHLSRPWKWLLAYLLTDEAYVVTALHYQDKGIPETYKHYFWTGAGITLWLTWQLSTAAGVFFGTQVPSSWSLDFTLALTFIGMVVPLCRERPNLAAALAAGIVAVLTFSWPYRLGLMAAALSGIIAGILVENYQFRKSRESAS